MTPDVVHLLIAVLVGLFIVGQVLYALTFLVELYFYTRPVSWVDPTEPVSKRSEDLPYIVLFYPVLREMESTMRTTFTSLTHVKYPADRYRIVAVPNHDDAETIASLERLRTSFPFLQILTTPPTTDPSWDIVWKAWDANPKAYWWHQGPRARVRDLPAKKTRQLIYAFYHTAQNLSNERNLVIDYIDADSAPPADHFMAAAQGLKHYDVLQAQNIAGNLNKTWASTWHSFDHMAWDGHKYPHLSGDGRQPFWVLGKGLFFKAKDLVELGGFHPWITIEDPEVGLRFWKNGKRLGVIASPLVEEVPETLREGVNQRKRWVAGFWQTLTAPLDQMDFTFGEKVRAWIIFLPCLSLWINSVGLPSGIWALTVWALGHHYVPTWTLWLAALNLLAFAINLIALYASTWRRTKIVLPKTADRLIYMLRVNPVSLMIWWVLWLVPLFIGLRMFLRDEGLTWQRTEKIDANHDLVRQARLRDRQTHSR